MKKLALAMLGGALACLGLAPSEEAHAVASVAPRAQDPAPMSQESQKILVEDYCVMCHSDALLTGGLTLESFDPADVPRQAEVSEKMIRKLRTGMMPPSYAPRPDPADIDAFVTRLENEIDEAYFASPNPGSRTFQRLNRAEYTRSISDLLAIGVDVEALLPPDTISHSFDNVADVQGMSPTLMDSYLRAADVVSRLAVGDPSAGPSEVTYKVPRTASQRRHVEGAPFGTRGGISVMHNFVADGEYIFKIQMHASPEGYLFGKTAPDEQIDVSMDGVRVALLGIDPLMSETDPAGMNIQTVPIAVKAGPRRVTAAFIKRSEAPIDDLLTPIEHTLADSEIGVDYGITTVPHLRDFSISGPYNVTGVSDTPSRRRIFTCRPTSAAEELPCAEDIVTGLAARAYRGPLDDADLEALMSFYTIGRDEGDFESGVRMALQAILASPRFIFRLEEIPVNAELGASYRIGDVDLASRLSFFLWSGPPDEELVSLARKNELSNPEVLAKQVARMLEHPRAEAMATRFASQWLRLQDLHKLHPDALTYPLYDATLADALKQETELFFENLFREDRSVLELLTADYTFVNDRLAQHYQIPNVTGGEFRRVSLEGINANRRGLLGQGSILALTSIANRTSPVQRGKWVMEVLLGSPPPPPPPNVPDLEATSAVAGDRLLSVREQMEEHRSNPACTSCHVVIDPIGLALENFDVTGAWRTKDRDVLIDPTAELYDGAKLDGPLALRDALLSHSEAFIRTFTESLMTFALGRRVEHFDMPAIRKISRDAARNDYRLSSFILGVVDSVPFRMSRLQDSESRTTDGY
ncbi:MAG TPA: DUF1592 domain-containing protein [Vicinamibacteria bacterium]|nr:DUF1592 domain-containing protein [Vicinamibacteria bacterium]